MPVMNFTEARIRDLPLGSGIWRDEQAKGLLVICHKSTRTYAVQGDVRRDGRHVRTVRKKIDRCDRVNLKEARRKARELMSQIQSGIDPTAGRKDKTLTLKEALEIHFSDKNLRQATIDGYNYHMDKYLAKFRNRAIVDLSRSEIRDLHDTLKTKSGSTTASSVMRTLRAIINTAMRVDERIESNPVKAIRIAPMNVREVAPIDLKKWWLSTETMSPIRRDLHRSYLLTGARSASLLRVKREDIDLEKRVMTFNHLKTGGRMLFPMGDRLANLISKRVDADQKLRSEWLWPSATSKAGRVVEPKDQRRDVPSPHAYRHLARTMMIAAGVPYAEGALLLAQKLPGASGGYVHPEHLVEHLRPFAQSLENHIFEQLKP